LWKWADMGDNFDEPWCYNLIFYTISTVLGCVASSATWNSLKLFNWFIKEFKATTSFSYNLESLGELIIEKNT